MVLDAGMKRRKKKKQGAVVTKAASKCFPEVRNVNKEAGVKISRRKTVKELNMESYGEVKGQLSC